MMQTAHRVFHSRNATIQVFGLERFLRIEGSCHAVFKLNEANFERIPNSTFCSFPRSRNCAQSVCGAQPASATCGCVKPPWVRRNLPLKEECCSPQVPQKLRAQQEECTSQLTHRASTLCEALLRTSTPLSHTLDCWGHSQ